MKKVNLAIIILAVLIILFKFVFIIEYLPRHGWGEGSEDWICMGVRGKTKISEICKVIKFKTRERWYEPLL